MTRLALKVAAELSRFAAAAAVILGISAAIQPAKPADTGCEAATMILLADRERVRREYQRLCLEASGMPDNLFARIECEGPR